MNDFTKEELEELLDAIGWKLGEGQADKLTFPLEARLKALIENYCEQTNKNNPMYKCIRCESKVIDAWFEIKYGLHNWFLCVECSPQFSDWVRDKHADNGCPWAKEHFKRKYGDK